MVEVRKVFNMAQDGVVASRLCDLLTPIQNDTETDEFWNAFFEPCSKNYDLLQG